jgi:hypothetical protein
MFKHLPFTINVSCYFTLLCNFCCWQILKRLRLSKRKQKTATSGGSDCQQSNMAPKFGVTSYPTHLATQTFQRMVQAVGLWPRSTEARSIPHMWDLWWMKWNLDSFLSEFIGFNLLISFHQSAICVLHSPNIGSNRQRLEKDASNAQIRVQFYVHNFGNVYEITTSIKKKGKTF